MEVSLAVLFLSLIVIGHLTKRRFGLLVIGLILGYLISINAGQIIAGQIATQGVKLESPPLLVVTGVGLVLFPSILMAFVGPVHYKMHHRWVTAIGYAFAGTFFSLLTIAQNATDMITKGSISGMVLEYRSIILVAVALLALFDIFMIHSTKHRKKEK
jgi:hypothetical protein